MSVINVKEIYKEWNLAKKHFKKAIELGKKNIVVGQINFAGTPIKPRVKKAKVTVTIGNVGKADLTDLDKDGYMSKRRKPETADNA